MTPRTYTHPDVLTRGVQEGWANPETDPTRIDWAARQAAAAIPFEVIGGRPVNPHGPTGVRYGRNELGHWGEALAADALVSATDRTGRRWIVTVERKDGWGWALPGGHVDPGETPLAAAVRELAEETGLTLSDASWTVTPPRYVPDPRASDEAWMVTVLCTVDLGTVDELPTVVGGDDAARAAWVLATSYEVLTAYLADTYRARVFAAHTRMLTEALNAAVAITTFGYLHGPAPSATLTLDLRTHFRDPHVRPELRYMTAHDAPVRQAVMTTPGIAPLVKATAAAVRAFLAGPTAAPVSIAVGCAGGRHRAATVGMALADSITACHVPVTLTHRDLGRPVVER